MPQGPRIYNLFPLLVGAVEDWESRLPGIADMKFNWVFLNPFHLPGASGSLYAIKDYYQLHPLFQGEREASPDTLLSHLVEQAEASHLSVMMDLTINHTAKDSGLVDQHPEWFAHNEDGSVRCARAVDPDDPEKVTVWEDLAQIDYRQSPDREGLSNYWKELVRHYIDIGFHGFRCDAAYQVPGEVWSKIIQAAREANPEATFFAETLGAQPEQIGQLRSAGFDYFFNSAKWWDFQADWLLQQYERFRHIAPSIAFPESHDTTRLAAEANGDERHSRFWYLFTATFSSGVMMPIGYEFGFRRQLHVAKTRPQDWEKPHFDLTAFVRAVNEMKARTAVLNEEGPQTRFTSPEAPIVGLMRRSESSSERVATLLNPDPQHAQDFLAADLMKAMSTDTEAMEDITPLRDAASLVEHERIQLGPEEIRVFWTAGE
ncbi:MAG: alpha-amylase family glycosyl hydrolase [Gammaproteobacteria bacterium]|jgi:starch synthase (maltosyl-transferring)